MHVFNNHIHLFILFLFLFVIFSLFFFFIYCDICKRDFIDFLYMQLLFTDKSLQASNNFHERCGV